MADDKKLLKLFYIMHQQFRKLHYKLYHKQCNKQAVSLHRDCALVIIWILSSSSLKSLKTQTKSGGQKVIRKILVKIIFFDLKLKTRYKT